MMREPLSPHRLRLRFLALAAGMLAAAVLGYLVMAALPPVDPTGLVSALQTGIALLLLVLVALALLFLLAAYHHRLARLLADRGQYLVDLWRVPFRFFSFGGFFESDPLDEKKRASQRKQARAERRRLARQTRRTERDPGNTGQGQDTP